MRARLIALLLVLPWIAVAGGDPVTPHHFRGWRVARLDGEQGEAVLERAGTRYRVRLAAIAPGAAGRIRAAHAAGRPVDVRVPVDAMEFAGDDLRGVTPDCRERPFGWDDLRALAERHASVRDLLAALPRDALQRFTFVHDSRASNPAAVSAERPRVIRFGTDARTILAYTCEAGGPKRLEVITFDDAAARFRLHLLSDGPAPPPDAEGATRLERVGAGWAAHDPASCRGCHGGDDPRPNWEGYPEWTGAFGSDNDKVGHLDGERFVANADGERYLAFRRAAADDPCYATLPWPTAGPAHYPYVALSKHENLRFRPNTGLTLALARLNARRLARKLRAHPRYAAVERALLREALGCAPQADLEAEVRAALPRYASEPDEPFDYYRFDPRSPRSGGPVLYFAGRHLGLRDADWNLAFVPHPDQQTSPLYITGQWPMPRFVQSVLLRDLARARPELGDVARTARRTERIFGAQHACVDDIAGRPWIAEDVRQRACAALPPAQPTAKATPAPKPASPPPVADPGLALVTARCHPCHAAGEPLPFFADTATARHAVRTRPDFVAAVLDATAVTDDWCPMPEDGVCLTPPERALLKRWLEALR
ncbi:MAG: hypothetical protein H6704_13580 [Myxococcales bacterium]|nr:hypothetical protein [Myxococcales bacterium]